MSSLSEQENRYDESSLAVQENAEVAVLATHIEKGQQWRFEFHGNAGEYFNIWIVNIFLTIITLGIYAPWAKVRRLRYFYGNTRLGGDQFDFTALPSRILIGRLIAVVLFAAFSVLSELDPAYALAVWGVALVAVPWLVRSTMRFRARNSKYGNSRFYFSASQGQTYWLFAKCLLVTLLSFGLLYPVALYWFKSYQINHLHIGSLKFELQSGWADFYGAVLKPYLWMLLAGFVVVILGMMLQTPGHPEVVGGLFVAAAAAFYILMIGLFVPLTQAYLFRATWQNVQVGNSRISTDLSPIKYAWIKFTNYVAMVFTLGLLHPWAAVRLYRYQSASLQVDLYDDPQNLINQAQNDPHSIGEEIADVFDIDISL